jgi:UDP-GlcNAc:undecaprenyl-phosphate/decaprenyl-phosphate GlcNAc-1-phosphate transferase
MQTYILTFIASTVGAALVTPLARLVAFRFNIVSMPGGRHIHGRSVPRLGGVGIFGGVALAVAGLSAYGQLGIFDERYLRLAVGLLAGSCLMFGLGLFDDIKGVRAVTKLAFQVLAALVAWAAGFRVDVVDVPFLENLSMGVFSLPLTVLWVVGIINAINLIDGLDGLAAGVVFFAGVTNFVVASLMGTTFVALVMASIAGAVLGFLFYNFNPARIFMGDSGSYFLGFVLAVCGIAGPLQKASAAVSILVPVVALGVPIIDTLLAMVRRFLERRPLFAPDKGHIHHRLLDMGITHRRAVLIIYAVTVALCLAAIGIALGRKWEVGAAILAVSGVLFGLIRFIGYFEYLWVVARQKNRIHSRHVEWMRKVVMTLPSRLDRAPAEQAVREVVAQLAREARLFYIDIVPPDGAGETQRCVGDDYTDTDERDVTKATFPCGEGKLRYLWKSEFGEVSPQMDIMLQLVTDQVELHLRRTGCAWVKAPVPLADADRHVLRTPVVSR